MPDEESKMLYQEAVQIIRDFEKDVNSGKITDEKIKKDLDIARKIAHNHWIVVFRRMR